jgi:hypothetical protein
MGLHGLGGYRGTPRATQDVDVLVRKKDIPKAVKGLRKAFPDLKVQDTVVVVRFIDPATNQVVIDLMKPTQDVYRLVFRHTIPGGKTHDIPNLEMALISKFAAMTSPYRDSGKKLGDGWDFVEMVRHNRKTIDLGKLGRLADRVYPGGSSEIAGMIKDIDAGRTLRF